MNGLRRLLRDDRGFTLVELLTAMLILSVVLALVGAAVRTMTMSTVRVNGTGQAVVEQARIVNRLDRLVPYAAAINTPGQVGGRWYVEFRTDVQAGGLPASCWQFRTDAATRLLQYRSWRAGTGASLSSWVDVGRGVQARAGTPPFRFFWADEQSHRQRLAVTLDIVPAHAPPVPLQASWVARNSSSRSVTNNIPSGQTQRPLTCTEVPRT